MAIQHFSGADALIYDSSINDWPGEIDFYMKLAKVTREKGQAVLDIACGTGRIFIYPQTGVQIRPLKKWVFTPVSQTATLYKIWEELDEEGTIVDRKEFEPMSMHVAFPFEMEHLLCRVGLSIQNLFGDFYEQPFTESSSDMIWVALEPAD